MVPSLGKDEGAIEFSLNGKNYSHEESPTVVHQPALGDIVLFPSSLHHRTIPFTTEADRIIVSSRLNAAKENSNAGTIFAVENLYVNSNVENS